MPSNNNRLLASLRSFASRLVVEVRTAFGVQATHTAICNAQSSLDVRLARWLLMAHDHLHEQ
jgi:hypothetical protein